MNTLLLSRVQWDLCLDSNGNIAMATAPYALAQDVASAVRLFLGECYYDTTKGIPYWTEVLGMLPPASLLKALISDAALTVPGVVTATVIISSFNARSVTGSIQFTDSSGGTTNVVF
jgi:hypothetical protein